MADKVAKQVKAPQAKAKAARPAPVPKKAAGTPREVRFIEGAKKVNLYSVSGDSLKTISLPRAFDAPVRPDIIRKTVTAARANRRQPYGPAFRAGQRHSVATWGKGRGTARVQRLAHGSTAAESPNNVGGRRSHPPKPWADWSKKVNRKERLLARNSALAAAADPKMVRDRGHRFSAKSTLPVVVEDKFQDIEKVRDIVEALDKLGILIDVRRSEDGRHTRAGVGKMRGRRTRVPRSVLIVAAEGSKVITSARNLSGVEVVSPSKLDTEHLAPGGDAGRLTLVTESALKAMGEW